MVEITVTVEHYLSDACFECFLCYEFADLGSLLFLGHGFHSERGSRHKGVTRQIVNNLSVDLFVTAEHAQTRTLCGTVYALANSKLYLDSSFYFLRCHNLLIFN